MGKMKSERHHWWPESVSRHWADANGGVHWLLPDGSTRCSTPDNFGAITSGHHIKLSSNPGESSLWDESFESEFQTADNNFPDLIEWLNQLNRADSNFDRPISSRIVEHEPTDEQFRRLVECLASLAVRSPMHRSDAVRTAELLRPEIGARERNSIIGLNIRHSLRNAVKELGGQGKAMVVFSPDRELLFGDGFFNNLRPPIDRLLFPRMFVPLTPRMGVVYARPARFHSVTRMATLVVSASEADRLNFAIHVYAKDAIFYRSERPAITSEFASGEHKVFSDQRNPIDELIREIPGIS